MLSDPVIRDRYERCVDLYGRHANALTEVAA